MLRPLTLLHRWLGVSVCLLFAMWFATGIVMHFVPFPALTEAERIAGLAPVDPSRIAHGPGAAASASRVKNALRVRLLQRSDGPVYLVSGASGVEALHAADLTKAAVSSEQLALAIAVDSARQRRMDPSRATFSELANYDQWTVPNRFDLHRPLYRITLDDDDGTELYVSSATGEVVLDTTRRERWWNYVGSVAHWIYPTVLRSNWVAWDKTVWTLSLVALVAAMSGGLLGAMRIKSRVVSPYRGWHAWHHVLGLLSTLFVLTWSFSGWLSMDHGRLFSRGQLTEAEQTAVAGALAWDTLPADDMRRIAPQGREVEWFVFDRRFYRRVRTGLDAQFLFARDFEAGWSASPQGFLEPREIRAFVERMATGCKPPVMVDSEDDYVSPASMPNAPVYRSVCGNVWFHVDGASGAILERFDPSRRAYRWLYSGLHTMDFPMLSAHPTLRAALIVILCGCGFVFSLTGVVIGWRRLRLRFAPNRPAGARSGVS